MHEMSIALGIVQLAEKKAKESNARYISKINIQIGTLSGIEIDSFEFAWPLAVKETLLEKAVKILDVVPAKAKCSDCNHDFDIHNIYDACPKCGSYFKHIYQGKELKVKYIEIEK